MIPSIQKYCVSIVAAFDTIPSERKHILEKISDYIIQKLSGNAPVNLVYICTHNSRRSHFGQVWAHVAAHYYHIPAVHSFSGGTEATTFNKNAIGALKRVGFHIQTDLIENNPKYLVFHDEKEPPSLCFSKKYDDQNNPQKDFAAIMTCSDAEENCPFIPGADLRIATTYDDPKAFDGTTEQDTKYDERCKQIALETMYIFSKLASVR